MKKKKAIYITLTLVCILTTSYLLYNKENDNKTDVLDNGMSNHLFGENLVLDSKIVGEGTLDSIEQQTSEIVIAQKKSQDNPTIIKDKEDHLIVTYTLSHFIINEVIEGTDLNAGTEIIILENEARDNDEKITYHVAGYEMMVTGNEYLLFLRKSETDPYYLISGVNFGKVPLNNERSILRTLIDKNPSDYSNELQKQYEEIDAVREEARQKYIEQK